MNSWCVTVLVLSGSQLQVTHRDYHIVNTSETSRNASASDWLVMTVPMCELPRSARHTAPLNVPSTLIVNQPNISSRIQHLQSYPMHE